MTHSNEPNDVSLKVDVNRPCVVCSSVKTDETLFSLTFPDLKYPGEFVLKKCGGCGVIYNSPRLNGKALSLLYERNYYLFLERPSDALNRVASLYNVTIRELMRVSGTTPSEVLEIGCAKGYLLALLRNNGWSVRGVELSEYASESAREQLDIDVFTGTVESFVIKENGKKFPCVYATDVIEHVPDPRSFVGALGKLVAPKGWLLVSTPNAEAEGIGQYGPMWGGFNPFHIWCFTKENLMRLLGEFGFEVVEAYTYGNLACSRRESPLSPKARIRRLLPWPLLDLMRRLKYHALDFLRSNNQSLEDLVSEESQALANRPVFRDTVDGEDNLRRACVGENLVVIARRKE